MVPPPPQPATRRVARPAARYRPGKAPLGASIDDFSDSDESIGGREHELDDDTKLNDVKDLSSRAAAPLNAKVSGQERKTAGIIISEPRQSSKKLDLRLHPTTSAAGGEEDEGSSEYETDTDQEEAKPTLAKPVFRKHGAPAPPQAAEGSGSSEYETDSEDESGDEEDDANSKPLLKPIFVPKRARNTIPANNTDTQQAELDAEAKAEQEANKRRKEAHDLAAATIKRQLAEKEHEETHKTDVDDTDGLDPEAEFEAWRQRELARLKRDHEALLEKRKEQEEIEKFKSLPEAEKERLGRERAAQLRAEKKEQRGNPAFMQKYYHKGSFFQDMDILKRDYTEKTTKDLDVSKLPKMMQVRNYGAKGRSKWTHLANEDTSKSAMKLDIARGASGSQGCFGCGGPHMKKDCPERNGEATSGSGANRTELASGDGSHRWGERASIEKESRSDRDIRDGRSPRRELSRHEREDHASGSRESRHQYSDEPTRRDHKDSRSRSSKDDREHRKHSSSSSSRRDNHESQRHHDDDIEQRRDRHHSRRHHRDRDDSGRDHNRHRSTSDRHDPDDRKHRHRDDERERRKRRERDDHGDHHHSSSTNRNQACDRKRTRLDA